MCVLDAHVYMADVVYRAPLTTNANISQPMRRTCHFGAQCSMYVKLALVFSQSCMQRANWCTGAFDELVLERISLVSWSVEKSVLHPWT